MKSLGVLGVASCAESWDGSRVRGLPGAMKRGAGLFGGEAGAAAGLTGDAGT